MDAEGAWHEGTWNFWCWKTPDDWRSPSSSTPVAYSSTWHWEHHSSWSNQWNSVDTTNNDLRQCGAGWSEVIPSFDGTDFSQFERRVRLFESNTRVAPQRRVQKLLERLEGRAFDLREVSQDLETPKGVEILLDHLRLHFERQPDEEADVFESCMPPAMIYGSMVVNGAKFSHHGTKSRLGGTLACWTPAKAKPKDRLMWGAGESRRLSIGASDRGTSAICGHNLSWWRSMPPRKLCGQD